MWLTPSFPRNNDTRYWRYKSAISREVKRNRGPRGNRPQQAHRLVKQRRRKAVQNRISVKTWTKIEEKLRQDWSPRTSLSLAEKEHGYLRVYQYIYLDKRSGGDLHQHLRCQKKRRKRIGAYDRRDQNPHQVSIEERPEIVDQRKRIGDWEADTIIGAGKQGAIVTLVARKSRFTPLKKVTRRTAAVEEAILDLLRPYPMSVHTNIFDNGKEFANH